MPRTLGLGVGEGLGETEADGDGFAAGDGDGVAASVGAGAGVGVGVVSGVGVGVGVGVAEGTGDGVGGGGGGFGSTQRNRMPVCVTSAVNCSGANGGGSVTRVKTGVRLEGRPRDSTRAAARTVVPGAGSGSRITIASPGATRCAVRVASLSKSPGWLVLESSTSNTPSRLASVAVRGATNDISRESPRWLRRNSVTGCGTMRCGGSGSPRFPHPLSAASSSAPPALLKG